MELTVFARRGSLTCARARERAYSSAFLSVCVSPERFRRGGFSPPLGEEKKKRR